MAPRHGTRAVALSGGSAVSLVRPLHGLEAYSEEMLTRSFRLDYPAFELIFCVADPADPIVPLVERLIAAHPRCRPG